MKVDEPTILIRLSRTYRDEMSKQELYEATRGTWRVGERREKVEYALAVYDGIVQEVYWVRNWAPAGTTPYMTRRSEDLQTDGRWEFQGDIAEDAIRSIYRGQSVAEYFSAHAQNPITYANC